jgi:phospholipid/cholesterol/gamma-HCH transport system ATP-binding protein
MSEEKDSAQVAAELASLDDNAAAPLAGVGPKGAQGTGVPPQIQPSPGQPERKAVARRQARVMEMLHTLPQQAQDAIKKLMDEEREIEEQARAESDRRQSERGNGRPQPSPTPDQGENATVGSGGSA